MADVKKILIIFVVAVLFAIFSFTLIDAIYPNPDYQDFCKDNYPIAKPIPMDRGVCMEVNVSNEDWQACNNREGMITYTYNQDGCATSYECSMCQKDYDTAREKHSFIVFLISSILGLMAIAGGVWLPPEKNEINNWVGTGFMFGGLITIFIGTGIYFGTLGRVWRPVVILIELLLVLWLAYKKLGKKKK